MPKMYASFVDPADAERAAGALLDHGAAAGDLSILANESWQRVKEHDASSASAEAGAKTGITTTTAEDAGIGAVKGGALGLGVGALAALAAITIPGVGIVIGGGALAAAFASALGTAAAGAAAGGVVGLLKDQGIGDAYVTHYSEALNAGGSLLEVHIPTGDLADADVEQLLAKYGASNISLAGGEEPIMDRAEVLEPNPSQAVPVTVQETVMPNSRTTLTSAPTTSGAVAAAINAADIQPTVVDPVTGAMREGVAIDPLTGVERPISTVNGAAVFADSGATLSGFTLADVVVSERDASGNPIAGTVVDPVTGTQRQVQVVGNSIIYADTPSRT